MLFTMRRFLKYFLRGLVFVIPISFTCYIIYSCILWIDNLLPGLFGITLLPGTGLLLVIGIITLLGYISSSLIARPVFSTIENYIYKIPLINLIYSSTKDIVGAFVGGFLFSFFGATPVTGLNIYSIIVAIISIITE